MTLQQFISNMLRENDDTVSTFNTTVSRGYLRADMPTEDNAEEVDYATWSTPVHVWTAKFAYAIVFTQDDNTGEFEWTTTAIPREPSRNTVALVCK